MKIVIVGYKCNYCGVEIHTLEDQIGWIELFDKEHFCPDCQSELGIGDGKKMERKMIGNEFDEEEYRERINRGLQNIAPIIKEDEFKRETERIMREAYAANKMLGRVLCIMVMFFTAIIFGIGIWWYW